MSGYQYYEFLALDRPLAGKQLAELRSLPTRAEISATRFASEYHWGNCPEMYVAGVQLPSLTARRTSLA